MAEPLPFHYAPTKTKPKPVIDKSDESILRTLKVLLEGKIYASWDIDKPGEKDRIRREFRAQQRAIYPDHPHLIEQALAELLPGGILEELDQTPPPVVVNATRIEEPTPAPGITTPVAEPVQEIATTATTQSSSSEETPAALSDIQKGLCLIQQAMTIAHTRGMTVEEVYPYVDKIMKNHGMTALADEFIHPLLALWQQPAPEPPPQSHTVPTDTCAEDDEEWVSTWDLPTSERLDRIVDFLIAHRGEWFTRAQIEIGAGYRCPDDHLPPEQYEKLKRRVQRDLALLAKDRDVVHTTRPNAKKNIKGQNNDTHLYRLADPDQDDAPDPDAFPAGLRRDLGAAMAAFDQRDMDKLIEHLTPVSNWLARVAGVNQDASS